MAAEEFKQEVVLVNNFEYKTGYIWQIDCKVKNLKIEDIISISKSKNYDQLDKRPAH